MTELEYNDFLKSETDLEREANLLMLEHHGVKGMKWGDKNGPPYPLSEAKKKDNRERAKKQREQKEGFFAKRKKKKAEKQKAAAAQKKKEQRAKEAAEKKKAAAEAKKKAEENEKLREKLLTSTDAKFINEHKNLLSYQELNDRLNRITLEKRVSDLASTPKKKSALKQGEKILNSLGNMATSIGKISEATTKTYNAYNVISSSKAKKVDAAKEKQKKAADEAKKAKEDKKKAKEDKKKAKEDKKKAKEEEKKAAEAKAVAEREKKSTEEFNDFMSDLWKTKTTLSSIQRSSEILANASPKQNRQYQQTLLKRAEEERQKRKKNLKNYSYGKYDEFDDWW